MVFSSPYACLPLIYQPVRRDSIAFGNSTSQRIYSKQRTHKIGGKGYKYGLKHA